MQPAIDRVLASLTAHHPMSERGSEAVRDEATQVAARLLESYKAQLAQRSTDTNERQQS